MAKEFRVTIIPRREDSIARPTPEPRSPRSIGLGAYVSLGDVQGAMKI